MGTEAELVLSRRIIAIDPGLSGAVAVVDLPVGMGPAIAYRTFDTPTFEVVKGKKRHREYVINEMYSILVKAVIELKPTPEILAVIEHASPRPAEGVVSSFKSGFGVGIWHALLVIARLPFRVVSPSSWKKAQGLIGTDKNYARKIAQQRFPLADLARVKDHGRAEALLLADHARQQNW